MFRRMSITAGHWVTCLELILKLGYSSSEGEHNELHGDLKSNCQEILQNVLIVNGTL